VIYGPVAVDDTLAMINQGTRAPMLLDRQTGEFLGELPSLVDDYPVVFEVGADLVVVSYHGSVVALRPAPA
jgi:hypothetical protein